MKHNFFFDYIYYRLNKFYFKWDGRGGITSIIGVTMIQVLILLDIIAFITRLFLSRAETRPYTEIGKIIILIVFVVFLLINFKKYSKKYNKLRFYWKDENKKTRMLKGFLVILSLVIPWVPLILIGIYM